MDSNHVLRIFSPAHTPCLPRFQVSRSKRIRTSDLRFWRPTFYQLNYTSITRKQKDSNLRSLLARHLSRVLFSTAKPCFLCFDIAKVDSRYAVFLRNKNFFIKNSFYIKIPVVFYYSFVNLLINHKVSAIINQKTLKNLITFVYL